MKYSKKLLYRIEALRFAGVLSEKDGYKRVVILEKTLELSFLIDESDGVIADCKFRAFGGIVFLASCDLACELLMRKNIIQAKKMSVELLDQTLRDSPYQIPFPEEEKKGLLLIIQTLEKALLECKDLVIATPVPQALETSTHPEWAQASFERKKEILESIIDVEIRPYIEMDEGGIEIVQIQDSEVHIRYSGSCTSCHSATGSTLSAIQEILRTKVDSSLLVIPHF